MPREPALLAERSQDDEARAASSERMPRWHPRASRDGAWAAPSRVEHRATGGHRRLKTCGHFWAGATIGQAPLARTATMTDRPRDTLRREGLA